jgi:hypothetical protein
MRIAGRASEPQAHKKLPSGLSLKLLQIRNQTYLVGANLVFALNVQGEHKVRPYDLIPFDCEMV